MALFTETILALSVLFVPLVGEIRNLYDLDEPRESLEEVLRFYIWGGREGVSMLERLASSDNRTHQEAEAAILAWPALVELVRGFLDEPGAVRNCCPPLRELALRYVGDHVPDSDRRLGTLFQSPRARQFTRRMAHYATAVGKLPQDFAKRLESDVDGLVQSVEALETKLERPNTGHARHDAAG